MGREELRAVLVRAVFAGVAGGLLVGAGDFFAGWLWMPQASDRILYGLRLAGLLAPLGGLAALGVVSLDRAARPRIRRAAHPSRLAPLPLLAVLAPALIALAFALLSGGRVSRLPLHGLLVALTALTLVLAVYFACRVARWIARRRALPLTRRALLAASLIGLAVLLEKADQTLYPRHYDAIHAAMGALAWTMASLGAWVALPRRMPAVFPEGRRGLLTLIAALALVLASLPGDHDGRAALLSPRAGSARSAMLAVTPLLFGLGRARASASAIDRARRAREARRHALAAGRLPRWDGAHVVIVSVDALRADHLGLYGYRRPISPNLDRLARESVVFERAWTSTPRSSYSLSSLMTGTALHPRVEAGEPLARETLASRFAARGAHTAAFYPEGIFFHQGDRLSSYRERELDFARRDAENHDAESLTDAVLAELGDLRARGEPPSLIWVHYFDVHEPYRERSLGDAPVDRYDGEIRNVDRAFARLLGGLSQLSREVVLVVTADHGEEHRDHGGVFHGGSLYEEQLRVPLIVRAPGLAPRRVTQPVSLIDVAPTLSAMIGAGPIGEGVDLRPMLVGMPFDRGPIRATEDGMRALVAWPDKLIDDERTSALELFDLTRDPGERVNLADGAPARVDALEAELAVY